MLQSRFSFLRDNKSPSHWPKHVKVPEDKIRFNNTPIKDSVKTIIVLLTSLVLVMPFV